jgi:hypothetical protein
MLSRRAAVLSLGITLLLTLGACSSRGTTAKPATTTASTLPVAPLQQPPVSAPQDETATTVATNTGKVGDTFTATAEDGSSADITITKVSTARYDQGTIEPRNRDFWQHPSNGLYLIVRMTVKGTGAVGFDLNTADFSVIAPDGQAYTDQTESDTWGQSIPLAKISSGQVRRGVVVFDVARAAGHGQIIYDPNASGEAIASWRY